MAAAACHISSSGTPVKNRCLRGTGNVKLSGLLEEGADGVRVGAVQKRTGYVRASRQNLCMKSAVRTDPVAGDTQPNPAVPFWRCLNSQIEREHPFLRLGSTDRQDRPGHQASGHNRTPDS